MRISYWSSDVCSSDLDVQRVFQGGGNRSIMFGRNKQEAVGRRDLLPELGIGRRRIGVVILVIQGKMADLDDVGRDGLGSQANQAVGHLPEIGSASCRERVWQ